MHTQSNIIPLPGLRLELGHRGQNCGIIYIAKALALDRFADARTVARHIALQIATKGFPTPISSRIVNGQLDSKVTPSSIWNRAAVDHWVEAQRSPADGASLSAHRQSRIDAALSARFASGGITGDAA